MTPSSSPSIRPSTRVFTFRGLEGASGTVPRLVTEPTGWVTLVSCVWY